ncbi:unnamed protein product, partial [Cladocopium goreaui]
SAEALRFASPRLRDDYEFMAKAVELDGRSLHYASSRLQADRTLLLEATKRSSWAIDCAPQALRDDENFKEEVLAVNPLARRFFGGYKATDSSNEEITKEASRPQRHDIIGRWRYEDDVESDDSAEDDFVVEFLEADPADATALSVRFLLADAMTSANCRATLEGRRLRIEEREGETLNIYEAMIDEVPTVIEGRFWCQSSGEGNSFQEGAAGCFSLYRLAEKCRDSLLWHCWDLFFFSIFKRPWMYKSSRTLVVAITTEGKASRWPAALQLLDSAEGRDVFAVSAAIGACGRGDAWHVSLWLLSNLKNQVQRPESSEDWSHIYGGAVTAVGRRWDIALELLEQMAKEAVRRNVIIYSSLMSSCCRQQQWTVALDLFKEVRDGGIQLDAMSYGAAVFACEKGQQWTGALSVLDDMHQQQLLPNVITCNAAIAACGGAWLHALQLLNKLGANADQVSLESAIAACGKAEAWQSCWLLLEDMQVRHFPLSPVAFGAAINGQEGHWQHALALLETMGAKKVRSNVIIYSSLCRVCVSAFEWSRALYLFEEMRCSAVDDGNVVAFSTAIAACEKGGKWEMVVELLEQMTTQQLQPNSVTLSSVIAAMNREGNWELALLLQHDLRTSQLEANVAVFNAAIDACGEGFQWRLVCALLQEMCDSHLQMDVISVSAAMSAMEQGLQWQRALGLLHDLLKSQMQGDALCLNAAINACKKESQWRQALYLMQHMEKLVGCPPDEKSFGAVASACERSSAWQSVLEILEVSSRLPGGPGLYALRSAARVAGIQQQLDFGSANERERVLRTCEAAKPRHLPSTYINFVSRWASRPVQVHLKGPEGPFSMEYPADALQTPGPVL